MGLILTRHKWIVTTWFAASLVYTTFLLLQDAPFADRYYSSLAASLPFSLGAMIHHYRLGEGLQHRHHLWIAVTVFLLNAIMAPDTQRLGFYLSLGAACYLILALRAIPRNLVPPSLLLWDERLGDLSYPIFLAHWPMAILMIQLGAAPGKGSTLFFMALGPTILLGWLVHRGIEGPIEGIRKRLRRAP